MQAACGIIHVPSSGEIAPLRQRIWRSRRHVARVAGGRHDSLCGRRRVLLVHHLLLVQLEVLRDGRRRRPPVFAVKVALGHADNLRIAMGNGNSGRATADRLNLGVRKHLLPNREAKGMGTKGEWEGESCRQCVSERFLCAYLEQTPRYLDQSSSFIPLLLTTVSGKSVVDLEGERCVVVSHGCSKQLGRRPSEERGLTRRRM